MIKILDGNRAAKKPRHVLGGQMTSFTASKPFQIRVKKHYRYLTLNTDAGRKFWKQEGAQDYKKKRGCYIFGISHGTNVVPKYIGKAAKTFGQEIFQPHKKEHYNRALKERKNGQATLIFISHNYKRKPNVSSIEDLETQLIKQAVRKHLALTNLRKKYIGELKVQGVFDFKIGRKPKGRFDGAAKTVRKMMKF